MNKKSNWKGFPKPQGDTILALLDKANADIRENKVNMTAGIYRDEELNPFLLHSVRAALQNVEKQENLWFSNEIGPEGDTEFTKLAVELMLGSIEPHVALLFEKERVAAIHCQSGGTALYIAFELVKKFAGSNTIYLSGPTWPIHNQMAIFHQFDVKTYPYYDSASNNLNFDGMMKSIGSMEKGSVFLIQPCGQNPTGYDPNKEQWTTIIDTLCEKEALVIFDTAYYGFATGDLDNDAYPIRLMLKRDRQFIITQSYSKNFGLYSARVGFVAALCSDKAEKQAFEAHMKLASAILYGKPTNVGSEIVKEVIRNPELYKLWIQDLKIMSGRIAAMRQLLFSEISKLNPKRDWSFLIRQIGMFAYTGLTKEQVDKLIHDKAIYLIHSGRISICGLNKNNIPLVAKAFYQITEGSD